MAQGVKKKVLGQFAKAKLKPAKLPVEKEEKPVLRQVQKFQRGLPSILNKVSAK